MKRAQLTAAVVLGAMALAPAAFADHQPGHHPPHGEAKGRMDHGDARQVIAKWGDVSKKVANAMIDKYGQPDGVTPTMLVWHDNGPWKKTIVHSEERQHLFPMKHVDVLEQFINYQVPPSLFDELAQFDGSVVVDRTGGVMSARCDKEAANMLALNLANEIVTGKRKVADARKFYAHAVQAMMNGKPTPYTERLMFNVPKSNTADPDHPVKP